MSRTFAFVLAMASAWVWAPSASARTCRITYLTSATAYVDAGLDEGLAVGARIEVVRDGVVIATLVVTDASTHRAACAVESTTAALAVGDEARFAPRETKTSAGSVAVPAQPQPTEAPAPTLQGRADPKLRALGLRGRVGVRFLGVFDQSGFGGDMTQPSADVRVDGTRVAGSSFDIQVDVRARHTTQSTAEGTDVNDGEARVYRLNTVWRSAKDRLRVTAGRQFSSALTSVSTFDGVQAEYQRERWGGGVFAGTQPRPIDYGFSTDIQEYGAFLRTRSAPRAPVRWEVVLAGIGSYEQGEINREYVAVLGRVASSRLSLILQQQIDVYRGWRQEAEDKSSSITSTFTTARYRATRNLDLDLGYDNRRDVRVYHDYIDPEVAFDDSYREGVWGGAALRFAQRFRVGAVVRSNGGGSAGDATSYTLTASASRVSPANLDLRVRSTRYDNERSDGWMFAFSSGWAPDPRVTLGVTAGLREDNGKTIATPDVSTSWIGADLDLGLADGWYLNLSGEHNGSGDDAYDQVYTGLSWRF
ncbi:MAG TPA: hypothetical protein VEC56_05400 [Candidatus Krumholzibacteria bacterium]|nr:hypothetical protein [Candidatus Krumholzibacteria bacterium]